MHINILFTNKLIHTRIIYTHKYFMPKVLIGSKSRDIYQICDPIFLKDNEVSEY